MTTKEDSIRKRTVLRAPLERVWTRDHRLVAVRAMVRQRVRRPVRGGRVRRRPDGAERGGRRRAPTSSSSTRACAWTAHVVAIEPMRRFAFRWNADAESDALTTVSFDLEETADGVALTITESGFDALPPSAGPAPSSRTRKDGTSRPDSSRHSSSRTRDPRRLLEDIAPVFAALGDPTRLGIVVVAR